MGFSTHGMSDSRLYNTWKGMRRRCDSPKHPSYKSYGGRGISYCKEWRHFEPFMEWSLANGYSYELQLDRIDNKGDYCPENCRYVTPKENNYNKRTNNTFFHKGKERCIAELAEMYNLNYQCLFYRLIKYNWPLERALNERPHKKGKHTVQITYKGHTSSISDMARKYGFRPLTLAARLRRGMSVADAIEKPLRKRR